MPISRETFSTPESLKNCLLLHVSLKSQIVPIRTILFETLDTKCSRSLMRLS
jgi:hypothetical protein